MNKQNKKNKTHILFFSIIIIIICILLIFFTNKEYNSPYHLHNLNTIHEPKKTLEIVVTRYKEDLKWTLDYPFNKFNYIVYNKGNDELFEKQNVIAIHPIKNEGKCDHANLYHIYNNYNDLKDITIFLPGCLNEHYYKYEKSKLLLKLIDKYNCAFCICEIKTNDLYNDYYNLKFNSYSSITKSNIDKKNEFVKSDIRPFGAWYNNYINMNEEYISLFAIFSIDKRDIYNHDKYFYHTLMKEIEGSVVSEKCFYIEFSLMAMFAPMNYTYKINYSNGVYNFLTYIIFNNFEINGIPILQIPHIWAINMNYFLRKYYNSNTDFLEAKY